MLPDEIKTKRCLLRPLRWADVEDVSSYSSSVDWARYLPVPQPYLLEHARAYVQAQLDADRALTPTWAIERDGRVVGICNLIIQTSFRSAEIGIGLDPDHWGSGLAREVLKALIDAAFVADQVLVRIAGFADVRNERSRRMMEGLGFQFEGIMRSRRHVRGEQVDDAVYAVLRQDWLAHRGDGDDETSEVFEA